MRLIDEDVCKDAIAQAQNNTIFRLFAAVSPVPNQEEVVRALVEKHLLQPFQKGYSVTGETIADAAKKVLACADNLTQKPEKEIRKELAVKFAKKMKEDGAEGDIDNDVIATLARVAIKPAEVYAEQINQRAAGTMANLMCIATIAHLDFYIKGSLVIHEGSPFQEILDRSPLKFDVKQFVRPNNNSNVVEFKSAS